MWPIMSFAALRNLVATGGIGNIAGTWGEGVASPVEEVTDDKSLPKDERKRLQVEHAPAISPRAKQLKLADKICNVRDLAQSAPEGWSLQRCQDYLDWADRVVAGCRGVNPPLEAYFDQVLQESRQALLRGA